MPLMKRKDQPRCYLFMLLPEKPGFMGFRPHNMLHTLFMYHFPDKGEDTGNDMEERDRIYEKRWYRTHTDINTAHYGEPGSVHLIDGKRWVANVKATKLEYSANQNHRIRVIDTQPPGLNEQEY